jgi:hypothetical protein
MHKLGLNFVFPFLFAVSLFTDPGMVKIVNNEGRQQINEMLELVLNFFFFDYDQTDVSKMES